MTRTDSLPRQRALDVLCALIPLAGQRVVDVGCGEGTLVRSLTGCGAQVIGVECGAEMLAMARATPVVGAEYYVEGVGQALPLPAASTDVVVFMNSLHHVPPDSMAAALDEAARILVPGGMVVVNEPLAEGDFFALTRMVEDEEEVRAAALAAVQAAVARGPLRAGTEKLYLNPLRFPNYEAFAARMARIDPVRQARINAQDAALRAMFQQRGEALADGIWFYQPARLIRLDMPAAA